MTWQDRLLAAVYFVWGALCLLVLVPKLGRRIRGYDLLGLIPEWRFFAPNPARHDYHLLLRDYFPDGTPTGWTEVTTLHGRRLGNAIWNPGRRTRKALFDAVQELSIRIQERPDAIEGSVAYITILNHITHQPRTYSPPLTQFLILRSQWIDGAFTSDLTYLSKPHRIR